MGTGTENTKGFLKPTGEAQLVSTDTTERIVAHDRTNLKTYVWTYGGLRIEATDIKQAEFDKPGLRTIDLENDFRPEDVTAKAKPLKQPPVCYSCSPSTCASPSSPISTCRVMGWQQTGQSST